MSIIINIGYKRYKFSENEFNKETVINIPFG